jgi:hypothetical protein
MVADGLPSRSIEVLGLPEVSFQTCSTPQDHTARPHGYAPGLQARILSVVPRAQGTLASWE